MDVTPHVLHGGSGIAKGEGAQEIFLRHAFPSKEGRKETL